MNGAAADLHLLVGLIGCHLLPALFVSVGIYLVLGFLFGPVKLRRPAHRVILLYAALLKAAFAV